MTYGGYLHSEKVIFGRGCPLEFYRFICLSCLHQYYIVPTVHLWVHDYMYLLSMNLGKAKCKDMCHNVLAHWKWALIWLLFCTSHHKPLKCSFDKSEPVVSHFKTSSRQILTVPVSYLLSISNPFKKSTTVSSGTPTVSEPAKQIFLFFSRFIILFYDVIALSASASNHMWPSFCRLRITPLLQLKFDLQKRMSFGGNFAV